MLPTCFALLAPCSWTLTGRWSTWRTKPEEVIVPAALVDTLRALHTYLGGAVAVISGRPMDQIDEFLAPLCLPVAGVHGSERRAANGTLSLQTTYPLDEVQHAAQALVRQHPALRLEAKRGSLALHYRQAPELEAVCLETMRAAVEASPGLTLMRGKMVVEAKPGGASKGMRDRGVPARAAVHRPPPRSSSATTSRTKRASPPWCSALGGHGHQGRRRRRHRRPGAASTIPRPCCASELEAGHGTQAQARREDTGMSYYPTQLPATSTWA